MKKKYLSIFMVLALLFTLLPASAFAAVPTPGVESSATGDVIQIGDAETFTGKMPFATYRIYPSYLNLDGQYMDMEKTIVYDDDFVLAESYYDVSQDAAAAASPAAIRTTLRYNKDLAPGAVVDKTGKTIAELYFKGAAIDILGISHDVRLTISDFRVENLSSKTAQCVNFLVGNASAYSSALVDRNLAKGPVLTNDQLKNGSYILSSCPLKFTMKVEIVDAKYDGAFTFITNDIDVADRYTGTYDGDYSERVIINTAFAKSKAYLTSQTSGNLLNVFKSDQKLTFRSTKADSSTYYSGFAIQLKPESILEWRGGSCGTGLFTGALNLGVRPQYRTLNSDGTFSSYTVGSTGGNIRLYESYDDSWLDYKTEESKTEPMLYGSGKYIVRFFSNTKETQIDTAPVEGYELTDFKVTAGDNTTSLKNKLIGGTYNCLDDNDKNVVVNIKGRNQSNLYYNAYYSPITTSIKISKTDQNGSPMEGVTFTARGTSSIHGEFSISATTDTTGEAIISGIPYGTATDIYTLTEDTPDGYKMYEVELDGNPVSIPVTFTYSQVQQSFAVKNGEICNVTYDIQTEPEWSILPDDVTAPSDTNDYLKGIDTITVEPKLTTGQNYAVDPSTGKEVPGTWTVSDWDKASGFTITEDTTISALMTFAPDDVTLTYAVTPDPEWGSPEGSTVPAGKTVPYKTPVEITEDLVPAHGYAYDPVTGAMVMGTWEFTHWDHEDFVLLENTTVTGSWTFYPDPNADTYNVRYKVEEDKTWGSPEGVERPKDTTDYDSGDTVHVAEDMKTTQDYAIDPSTGKKVSGKWTFSSWDKDDFKITGDTVISGSWTFTPDTGIGGGDPEAYEVSYDPKPDKTWGTPEDAKTPTDPKTYNSGDTVIVADDLTSTQDYAIDPSTGEKVPGKWTFTPWDKDDFTIDSDTTISGTWSFTPDKPVVPGPLKVSYDPKPDATWGTPEDAKTPTDPKTYKSGDTVIVADDLTSTQDYAIDPSTGEKVPGKWTFTPWDKDDFTIASDTTISGTWSFTPDKPVVPGPLKVSYDPKPDAAWGLPEDAKTPTDPKTYKSGDTVIVVDDPVSSQGYAIDPKTGEKVPGKWTFSAWSTDDFSITGDTVITGTWIFTPDTGIGGGDPGTPGDDIPGEENPDNPLIPRTGDLSNIGLWTAMLVISAAALIAAMRKRKTQ